MSISDSQGSTAAVYRVNSLKYSGNIIKNAITYYDQQLIPTSPNVGDTWIERDLSNNIIQNWYWNGTYWLSTNRYTSGTIYTGTNSSSFYGNTITSSQRNLLTNLGLYSFPNIFLETQIIFVNNILPNTGVDTTRNYFYSTINGYNVSGNNLSTIDAFPSVSTQGFVHGSGYSLINLVNTPIMNQSQSNSLSSYISWQIVNPDNVAISFSMTVAFIYRILR